MENVFGSEVIMDKEDQFYGMFLDKAISYINGKEDGSVMKALNVSCSNVAKMKQTRSAMASLKYKMGRSK